MKTIETHIEEYKKAYRLANGDELADKLKVEFIYGTIFISTGEEITSCKLEQLDDMTENLLRADFERGFEKKPEEEKIKEINFAIEKYKKLYRQGNGDELADKLKVEFNSGLIYINSYSYTIVEFVRTVNSLERMLKILNL